MDKIKTSWGLFKKMDNSNYDFRRYYFNITFSIFFFKKEGINHIIKWTGDKHRAFQFIVS